MPKQTLSSLSFMSTHTKQSKTSSIMLTPFYVEDYGHEFVTQNTEPTTTAGKNAELHVECYVDWNIEGECNWCCTNTHVCFVAALRVWHSPSACQTQKPWQNNAHTHCAKQEIRQYKFKTNICRVSPGCVSPSP